MHKSVKRITSARSKSFGKCLCLSMICNVFMLFIYSFFHCFGLVVHVVFLKPQIYFRSRKHLLKVSLRSLSRRCKRFCLSWIYFSFFIKASKPLTILLFQNLHHLSLCSLFHILLQKKQYMHRWTVMNTPSKSK